jgi:copper chaperone CopZ
VSERNEQECHVDLIEVEVDPETLDRAEERFLAIAGMGCPTCVARVHNALVDVPGVLTANVELESSLAQVWLNDRVDYETLVGAVDEAGRKCGHRYLAGPVSREMAQARRAGR